MPRTTAISKVKGHADKGLVRGGRVREADTVGDDMADDAAVFGHRRVGAEVIDASWCMPGLVSCFTGFTSLLHCNGKGH